MATSQISSYIRRERSSVKLTARHSVNCVTYTNVPPDEKPPANLVQGLVIPGYICDVQNIAAVTRAAATTIAYTRRPVSLLTYDGSLDSYTFDSHLERLAAVSKNVRADKPIKAVAHSMAHFLMPKWLETNPLIDKIIGYTPVGYPGTRALTPEEFVRNLIEGELRHPNLKRLLQGRGNAWHLACNFTQHVARHAFKARQEISDILSCDLQQFAPHLAKRRPPVMHAIIAAEYDGICKLANIQNRYKGPIHVMRGATHLSAILDPACGRALGQVIIKT